MSDDEFLRLKDEYHRVRKAEILSGSAEGGFPSNALAVELRQFCVAGGHDLKELDDFLSQVDQEIVFYLGS